MDYRFEIVVNWLPATTPELLHAQLQERRQAQPAKMVVNWPVPPLSARLWEQLVKAEILPQGCYPTPAVDPANPWKVL